MVAERTPAFRAASCDQALGKGRKEVKNSLLTVGGEDRTWRQYIYHESIRASKTQPTPADNMTPQNITECSELTLDLKHLGFSASTWLDIGNSIVVAPFLKMSVHGSS